MSKIDINDILQSKTWDLISKTYGDTPVLEMNLRQLEQVCRAYGFTKFLTESKGQAKLAKTEMTLLCFWLSICGISCSSLSIAYEKVLPCLIVST